MAEALVDYLNFFEFVASLRRLGQIRSKEVEMLFRYYLSLLHRHPFVLEFVRTQDFENLTALLAESVPARRPA
jgi:hypothetical protein